MKKVKVTLNFNPKPIYDQVRDRAIKEGWPYSDVVPEESEIHEYNILEGCYIEHEKTKTLHLGDVINGLEVISHEDHNSLMGLRAACLFIPHLIVSEFTYKNGEFGITLKYLFEE